ncbi:MAG: elongation factor 4 [Candidatus Yanofskybacteria bacterium]|nr:elongation factor 4 [Candidatus Yanofskybacteria bacterium]
MQNIRNFCIVAHIDHGKSTLADRFLELTGTVEKRKMHEQFLDQMELERERGITIKLQPVRMSYALNANRYTLNLIDTPGHVDFSYEVSRSLAAVEGVILLVDATKGVQAQTLANLHLAQKQGLAIIPVINKIDLPNARVAEAEEELVNLLTMPREDILKISAKTGEGVEQVLEAVIAKITPSIPYTLDPKPSSFRALIFDSAFDIYKGVIAFVRVFGGSIKAGEKIKLFASRATSDVVEVGYFAPQLKKESMLSAGEIGYIATGLKDPGQIRVGDTIFKSQISNLKSQNEILKPLSGYQEPKPMVFASFYPESSDDYDVLKDALGKLKLTDASLVYEPESSPALGRGFRLGFLGMLHIEIVSERLRREFGLALIVSTPSVEYHVATKKSEVLKVRSAAALPDPGIIESIEEPMVDLEILSPVSYMGQLMKLLSELRSQYRSTDYLSKEVAILKYLVPLSEIITDFYDRLKSVSSGYASMSYEPARYQVYDLVRLDILVAEEKVEPFSKIVPRERTYHEGRRIVEKLKKILPRQWFAVSLQAAIGGKIIARETIPALRKDVTGYLYGGDVTRKKKLLEKQKRGKAKMKERGKVEIPQKVFLEMLKK